MFKKKKKKSLVIDLRISDLSNSSSSIESDGFSSSGDKIDPNIKYDSWEYRTLQSKRKRANTIDTTSKPPMKSLNLNHVNKDILSESQSDRPKTKRKDTNKKSYVSLSEIMKPKKKNRKRVSFHHALKRTEGFYLPKKKTLSPRPTIKRQDSLELYRNKNFNKNKNSDSKYNTLRKKKDKLNR